MVNFGKIYVTKEIKKIFYMVYLKYRVIMLKSGPIKYTLIYKNGFSMYLLIVYKKTHIIYKNVKNYKNLGAIEI
jgi:hypothetical protein